MTKGIRTACFLAAAVVLAAAAGGTAGPVQDQDLPGVLVVPPPLEKAVAVPGAAGWVDTGIDVGPGQEIRFTAAGRVDLQTGNPEASCGPEGVDLVTVEQPVPNANLQMNPYGSRSSRSLCASSSLSRFGGTFLSLGMRRRGNGFWCHRSMQRQSLNRW